MTANGTGFTSGGSKDPRLRIESGGEDGCDGEKEILMGKMKREMYRRNKNRNRLEPNENTNNWPASISRAL